MFRKYILVSALLLLLVNNELVAYAQNTQGEGGVYEVSTENPISSDPNGFMLLGYVASASVSGLLIFRK